MITRRTALKAAAVTAAATVVSAATRTDAAAAPVRSPIADWRFNELVAPYKSSAPGGPPLIRPAGSTARRVSTPFGGGIQMNGTTDYLRVPAANVGPLAIGATTGKVTVAAWVNSTDTNTAAIAGQWQESRSDPRRSYALFCDLPVYGGDDRVCMHVSSTGGPTAGYPFNIDFATEPRQITRSRWQFYTGTYDGAKAVAYLNGRATPFPTFTDIQGATYSKNPYYYSAGLSAKPVDFTVGAVYRDGVLINLFRGTVTRLRVWNVALTADEIWRLYNWERR